MNSPIPLDPALKAETVFLPVAEFASMAEQTLCILDARGQIRFCGNPAILGRAGEDLVGQFLSALVPGLALREGTPGYNLAYVDLWYGQEEWRRHSVLTPDGREYSVELSLRKLETDKQFWLLALLRPVPGEAGTHSDIVALMTAADTDSDAIMVTDVFGAIEYVNPAFEQLTGYAPDEVLGRSPALLKSGIHGPAFYASLWSRLREGHEFRGVFINRRKSGEVYFEDKCIRPYFGPDGRISHFVAVGQDISSRIQSLDKLPFAASPESPCGLPGRPIFFDRLQQAIARAGRQGHRVGVASVKLDHRPAGLSDEEQEHFLLAVGQCLQQAVREGDTVARIADGEFSIILDDLGDMADGTLLLERLTSILNQGVTADGLLLPTSASVGMAVFPDDGRDNLELLLRADCALQQAQAAGGRRHAVFDRANGSFRLYCLAERAAA